MATENSLLLNSTTLGNQEDSKWFYVLAWPLMMLYACWAALKVWPYRLWRWAMCRPSDGADEEEWKEYQKRWWLGPRNALWLFDSHWLGEMVRNGVTTSEALDGINAVPVLSRKGELNTWGGWWVRFWLNQPDGQAVRNRLRITFREILNELCRLWESRQAGQKIHVLSLASGSAQATIEAMAVFLAAYSDARGNIELHLVDRSGSSLLRATHLAKVRGVDSHVFIHTQDVKSFLAAQPDGSWDMVEMVGFLDYRKWKSAVEICGAIRRVLKAGGMFISAHIGPSIWSFVVRWVINWPLLLRRPISAYRRILLWAGFAESEVKILDEPHKIHPVGVCRKR
ncbi:class I SAM-dependent methyltransferase [Candidatus Peregrinibacteria bacterium]|nr:class I SAM-dependent methyltransferase [Candidatus Peregrinibacteria bacterium]